MNVIINLGAFGILTMAQREAASTSLFELAGSILKGN